jgi:hypothetical protein
MKVWGLASITGISPIKPGISNDMNSTLDI